MPGGVHLQKPVSSHMQQLLGYFFGGYARQSQSLWFTRGLCLFVLYQCLSWLLQFDLLFGDLSVVKPGATPQFLYQQPAFLLFVFPELSFLCLLLTMALAAAQLALHSKLKGWWAVLLKALLWLLVVNLHHRVYATLTGGHFLINQFLFFNCFLSPAAQPGGRALPQFFHNLAVLAVRWQLVLAYLLSGVAKLNDSGWLAGAAVNATVQVQHYFVADLPQGLGLAGSVLNYGVLAYQFLFPLCLLPGSWKRFFLPLGFLMHLYIALVMGLMSFGLAMVIGYALFWPRSSQRLPAQRR